MLPLVGPGIGALGVFTFIQTWNNFLVPILYLPGGSYRPLTAGLFQFISGRQIDIGRSPPRTLITHRAGRRRVPRACSARSPQGFISGAVKG